MNEPRVAEPGGAWATGLSLAGLVLVICGGPLFFSIAFRDAFVLPKMLIVTLGLAVLWAGLALRAWRGESVIRYREMSGGIIALLLAFGVSTMGSIDVPMSLIGIRQGQFHALLPFMICLLAYYGASYTEFDMELIGGLLMAVSVPICIFAMAQHLQPNSPLAWSVHDGRVGSTFGSPIFLGSFLALVLPISWHWLRKKYDWQGQFGVTVTFLAVCALGAARSRGGLMAGAAGILAYETGAIFALLMALSVGTMVTGLFFHSGSDLGRFEVWKTALTIWRAHPWLGSGPETFGVAFRNYASDRYLSATGTPDVIQDSAHNDILQVLCTMGVVGLAAYAFFLKKASGLTKRWSFYSKEARALGAALLALFIQAKVNPIPLSVLVAGAVILGVMDRPEDDLEITWPSRPISSVAAVAALALLALSGRMLQAEYIQRQGDLAYDRGDVIGWAQSYNVASQINPLDIYYTDQAINKLWAVIPTLSMPDRIKAAAASMVLADRSVNLHPNDSTAHEMRAIAIQIIASYQNRNRTAESYQEMSMAQTLYPMMVPYVQRLAQLAHERGDMNAYGRHRERIARLNELLAEYRRRSQS